MSFERFFPDKPEQIKVNLENKVNPSAAVPIFLIPGITGHSQELKPLMLKMQRENPQAFIYYYTDSRVKAVLSNKSLKKRDIEKSFEQLTQEIFSALKDALLDHPNVPCHVAGYSRGCAFAIKVAQLAKHELHRKTAVCIIDGPTPRLSLSHLKQGNKEATQDLIAIMQEVATLSGLPANICVVERIDPDQSIKKQLDAIYAQMVLAYREAEVDQDKLNRFDNYQKIIKHDLVTLGQSELSASTKVDDMLVLYTEDTVNKHTSKTKSAPNPTIKKQDPKMLGWAHYVVDDKHLTLQKLEGTHTDILGVDNLRLHKEMAGFFAARTKEYRDSLELSHMMSQPILTRKQSLTHIAQQLQLAGSPPSGKLDRSPPTSDSEEDDNRSRSEAPDGSPTHGQADSIDLDDIASNSSVSTRVSTPADGSPPDSPRGRTRTQSGHWAALWRDGGVEAVAANQPVAQAAKLS